MQNPEGMSIVGESIIGDAFGQGVKDCFSVGVPEGVFFEVLERLDGYVGVADFADYFSDVTKWPKLDKMAAEISSGRVLDIGCGAGRFAVELKGRGYDVSGLDSSPGAVEVCRARGIKADLGAAEELPYDSGSFDTVVLLGPGTVILGNPDTAHAALSEISRVGSDDLRVLITSRDPYSPSDPSYTSYVGFNQRNGRLGGEFSVSFRYRRISTPYIDYLFASPDELEKIADKAGLASTSLHFGDRGNYLAMLERSPR